MDQTILPILITSLLGGLVAGFFMHRSDFCVTGTFRDMFLFRDFSMIRVLVLMVVVTAFLFHAAKGMGLIAYYPYPLLGTMSLANALGGVVFGVGMVLAGGCVVGTLYRVGAGSAPSMLALVGLLVGSAAYAEVHAYWAGISKELAVFGPVTTIPEALGVPAEMIVWPLVAVGALVLWYWTRRFGWHRRAAAEGYIQPWVTAIVLAVIGLASYVIVGMPLGITTSYAKLGATLEAIVAPAHVAALPYFNGVPLNYMPPFATEVVTGGAGPALDGIAAIQYPLVGGIILGAMVSAILLKEWRLHFKVPARQYISVLIGGLLLGFASRMVPGCNVWHLWGGIPILAGQSILYLVGLIPGAWVGSWLLMRYVLAR